MTTRGVHDAVPQAWDAPVEADPLFGQARDYLAGRLWLSVSDALTLSQGLRERMQFALARRTAAVTRRDASASAEEQYECLRVEVTCTYKDLALAPTAALPRALDLLSQYLASQSPASSLDQTTDCELLALAGAVHKRWWDYDQRQSRLEVSLTYYQRAYGCAGDGEGDPETAGGYPAVNAAFVLDQLAVLELAALGRLSPPGAPALARLREAASLRASIADALRPKLYLSTTDYWTYATAAEAFVGLGDYDHATKALRAALSLGPSEWELESTARQLAALARLGQRVRGCEENLHADPAWAAVVRGLGANWTEGVVTSFAGKFGLALSGGGFRASLYHIGVLARLAELDLLRRIEVLSCVSGGSIIGARYYLEVRRLLETKRDEDIEADDFRRIVALIEVQFLEGVQSDVRDRLLADVRLSVRALTAPAYSRTHGLGQLLERTVLSPLPPREALRRNAPDTLPELYISSLYIAPRTAASSTTPVRGAGDRDPDLGHARAASERSQSATEAPHTSTHDMDFNPRLQNWRRRAKVPILILNATSLNTGHPWQFTASWMGEPASAFDARTSATPRLLQIRYEDAPAAFVRVRLGEAVAASAAVPGVFDPLPLDDLYADGIALRLADGGVHDNQGIGGLLDQNCTVLLVSDASGQLTLDAASASDPYSVSKRANDVLMSRVRETQMQLLRRMCDAGIIRAVVHAHLRLDLESAPLASTRGIAPGGDGDEDGASTLPRHAPESGGQECTRSGVRRDVAALLAQVRTDLDAFHDLEADALMYVGYSTMDVLLRETPAATLTAAELPRSAWRFLGIATALSGRNMNDEVMQQLVECLGTSRKVVGKTGASREGSRPGLALASLGIVAYISCLVTRPAPTERGTGIALLILLAVTSAAALLIFGVGRLGSPGTHRKSWWVRWSGLLGLPLWPWVQWWATEGRREYLRSGDRALWMQRVQNAQAVTLVEAEASRKAVVTP